MKRIAGFLLTLCLCASLFVFSPTVSAEDTPVPPAAAPEEYEGLYVKDGLRGLFLAYDATLPADERGYTAAERVAEGWWNRAGSGKATFLGEEKWTVGETGGFTYALNGEEFADTRDVLTYGIQMPKNLLLSQNFTVETVAAFTGVTNEDGTRFNDGGTTYANYSNYFWSFRFGYLSSISFPTVHGSIGGSQSFDNRWFATNCSYYSRFSERLYSTQLGSDAYLDGSTEYAPETLRVGRIQAESGGVTYTVGYGCNPDLGEYALTATEVAEMTADEPDTGTPYFSLFNHYPCTVYAVRVYDRALTDAEIRQNHFADIAAFTELPLDRYSAAPADVRERIHGLFSGIPLSVARETAAGLLAAGLGDKLSADILFTDTATFPADTGVGIRRFFAIDPTVIAALKTIGTTVSFTTVTGTKTSAVPDGEWKADIKTGGTGFSATVCYDGTDGYLTPVSIGAYATVTPAEGEPYILVAPDGKQFGQTVTMGEVARYYVNEYEGSVADTVAYENDPDLLSVLAALGVPVKESRIPRVCFYVDPENGNDKNDGKSEKTAFTSLAAANEAVNQTLHQKGKIDVCVYLSEGIHRLDAPFLLESSGIRAEDYCVRFTGTGEETEITGTAVLGETGDDLALEKVNGVRPAVRAFYVRKTDGTLLPLPQATAGDAESNHLIADARTTETEAILYLPASLFDGRSAYTNTEIHISTEWDFNILHIERVDYADRKGNAVGVIVNRTEFDAAAVPQNSTVVGRACWLVGGEDLFRATAEKDCVYYDTFTGEVLLCDAPEDDTLEDEDVIEAALCENLFLLDGVRNISFRDLLLTGTDDRNVDAAHGLSGGQAGSNRRVGRYDGTLSAAGCFTAAAIYGKDVNGVTVENILARYLTGEGISFRGAVENVVIRACEFSHIGGSALRFGDSTTAGTRTERDHNDFVRVENNYIHHTGEVYPHCCGAFFSEARECTFNGNTVTNTSYTGLSVGWNWGAAGFSASAVGRPDAQRTYHMEIAYNYFTDFMTCMRDGGAVYLLGGNAAPDVAMYFNYLHDNYAVVTEETGRHQNNTRFFMGFYHDACSSNWLDERNVVVNRARDMDMAFGFYFQSVTPESVNCHIHCTESYGIGLTTRAERRVRGVSEERDVTADILFTDWNNISDTDRAKVAAIFITSGSDLSEEAQDDGGVNYGAAPNTRISKLLGYNSTLYLSDLYADCTHAFSAATPALGCHTVNCTLCGFVRSSLHTEATAENGDTVCAECGAILAEKENEETENDPGKDPGTDPGNDPEEEKPNIDVPVAPGEDDTPDRSFPTALVIGAAGAVALVGAGTVTVVLVRKKRKNR